MAIFKKKDETKSESAVKKSAKPAATAKKTGTKELYQENGTAKAKKEKGNTGTGQAYRVLLKPLITEKAADMGPSNKYMFAVATDSNKIEIAKSVEEVYGIKPVSVNIINVSGKKVRQGRNYGQRKDWKKAVITLPAGKTINIYEGV